MLDGSRTAAGATAMSYLPTSPDITEAFTIAPEVVYSYRAGGRFKTNRFEP